MRTLYLCLRLLFLGIIVTGAVSSIHVIDTLSSTAPFLIFGYVCDEQGSPSSNITVNITNLNTSMDWQAETEKRCNYYERILDSEDVCADNVIEFNVTDGTACSITNHTVNQSNFDHGGIFNLNLTLPSAAPRIIGYAPETPVHDIENATQRFNITIDQMVNVTWWINGTEVFNENDVNESTYTNTSAAAGIWNVTAVAENENGTDSQEWIWQVTPPAATVLNMEIMSAVLNEWIWNVTQPPPIVVIYGEVFYENNTNVDAPCVIITNLNTSRKFVAENWSESNFYHVITGAEMHTGDVIEFTATDGMEWNTTMCVVTQDDMNGGVFNLNLILPVLAPSIDVELTPDDDPAMLGVQVINEIPAENKTVTITASVTDTDGWENIVSVTANITGPDIVEESPVSLTLVSNMSTTIARYNGTFNMSDQSKGEYNIEVKAVNAEGFTGTCQESFTYLHEAQSHLPIAPFIIYGSVSYADDTPCYSPFVVVTNLNTSEELVADNYTNESFYQLVTNSAFAKAGDTLKIKARNNGRLIGNATHTVNQTEIEQGVIEVNINKRNLPDFTVTNITFNPPEPLLIGDVVVINATIANTGTEREASVEFYDNKSITIERSQNDYLEIPINDTITLPDVFRIRVHFENFDVSSIGNITIYSESQLVEELKGIKTDHWTEWCDGDTIRIESWGAEFMVDRYEAVLLANESITLGEGDSTSIPAEWNLSLQEMGWATNGTHNITVRVDPCDQVIESNETNNEKTDARDVHPSLDFAVTEMSLNTTEPVLGDVVGVSANVSNYGVRNGTTVVGVYYDNRSIEIKRDINIDIVNESENYTSTDNISLPSGVLGARLHFNSLKVYTGHVDICDKNGRVVERFHGMGSGDPAISVWTDWIYSDDIMVRIELPYNPNMATHWCNYKIDRYEALIAEENVTLNASESKVVNASWQTGVAYGGVEAHNITVIVDQRDYSVEINETNNTLSKQVFVNGIDLAVIGIGMPCGDDYPNYCYVGQDVNVTATIANIGAVDATNFTLILKEGILDEGGANTSGSIFNEVHIERLNKSKNITIPAVWNPLEPVNYTITATIPHDNTDNDKTNNELFVFSEVEARYNFSVENVSIDPQDVRRGEGVNITATIGSMGHAGGNVSVAFFVNSTDFAGTCGERFTRIGTVDDVYVEVNETETVSMPWNVDVAGGYHMIAAVVNPDNKVEETDGTKRYKDGSIRFRGNETGNNVKNCTLYVSPLDLNITNLTLLPREPNIGDIVNVTAEITNNGSREAESTLRFYMEQELPPRTCILQLEDVMMRVHFDYIKMSPIWGQDVKAYVNNSQNQRKPVYFYIKNEKGEMMRVSHINRSTSCPKIDNWRCWDDVWTDWGYGDTFEIEADWHYSQKQLVSTDKYQVLLGNKTMTLGHGESMAYHGTWNTSPPVKAGEYYRLMASVENRTRYTNETYLGGTDLTITNLSVKPAVYDGDLLWVNATIENIGRMNATGFIVNFTEGYHPENLVSRVEYNHLELINTTHIEGLGVGNSINVSVSWNASIRNIVCDGKCDNNGWKPCNWTETADDYNIKVEINPLENKDKEEDADNSRSPSVHVDSSRDFNIMNLSFQVNNESCDPSELLIYDNVTLNATLNMTNLANQGGMVNVSFYIDDACAEHEIGNTSVAFHVGNGTGYAEIEWTVENFDDVDITGDHNMTVVVDPENRIYEIDNDQNNTYIQSITVMASDLLVESLEIHPKNPEGGETISIDVTIANHGDADASNITLTIYDWAERHIEDEDLESGIGHEQMVITRGSATAMRLYLDLTVDGGKGCIKDSNEKESICYHENFHGWTPWVMDNRTTIAVTTNETHSAYAEVSRVYHLASSGVIDTSTHDLKVNETVSLTVDWNPPTVGERFIAAIVDPDNRITENDEVNNRLTGFMSVQTADLLVSNLSLAWLNGTEISEDEIIKDGEDVRISANISNIGVEDTGSFDARFLLDNRLLKNETMTGLTPDESISVSVDWSARVGSHLLKVEADYRNEIDETNETNDIMALERYICGAELSGNTSWETLGLHGEILFGPDQPYDEDKVNITARITNSGYLDASGFNATLFFDYTPDKFQKRCNSERKDGKWINRTYPDAEYLYLKVTTPVHLRESCRHIIEDDVIVYEGDGSEVARPVAEPEKPCWVRVNGSTANVFITPQGYDLRPVFDIYFYPIYQNGTSMLFEGIDLPVHISCNLSMNRTVSVGNFPVMLIIDPENHVPEDEAYRDDNTVSRIMHVKPTRDFTVTCVRGERTNLSDLDTQTITANVSNIGLRNGTADVRFVDYEIERRRYKYHFDKSLNLSYLPIPPDVKLLDLDYREVMIVHRPGVDAIELHFRRITLYPPQIGTPRGRISVCNESRKIWGAEAGTKDKWEGQNIIVQVPGETAYIYIVHGSSDLDRYTTETEFPREEVRLNASKKWNESKNVTPMWKACTGNHIITATLDGNDKIAEMNESNNANSNLFHVNASRDLLIIGINITPEHPMDGESVDITAVFANNGSKSASFTVDLWANLTRNKPEPDEIPPDFNLTTNMSGDRIRYITLLKHANVTLAPGANTTVNATWNDISISGAPELHVTAIADPTDEIDEINESNNEVVKKIISKYPDLTIGGSYVPYGEENPGVTIKEIGGISGASEVTVRFERSETERCNKHIHGKSYCKIVHQNATYMQVHFNSLDSRNGYVIVNDWLSIRNYIKKYSGEGFAGAWSPWVEGDTIYIIGKGTGTYAEIDEYRWGNVSDEEIDHLPAGGDKHVEVPWEYEYPRMINVTVDPDNNITELNEDNNDETMLLYADLKADKIGFVSPSSDKLSLDAEKFKIDGIITNGGGSRNDIIFPVSDFNVTLEFRNRYPNGTIGDSVFNITEHVEDPLCANKTIRFEFDPNDKFEVGGNYTVFLIADSSGDVCESNELYPWGEYNNFTLENVYVYNTSGYTGGGELVNVAQGEVHGRVVYTIGDSSRLVSQTSDRTLTVNFDDTIPDGAEVKFARLYLYVDTGSEPDNRKIARPIEADMEFNGHKLQTDREYTDISVGSDWNVTYGLYCYDITNINIEKENVAVATRISPYDGTYWFGITAIGLLVAYEDEDEPLTKYWINEGTDVMMPDVETGLSFEDCIMTAEFDDVEREDLDGVNATLMTISSLISGRTLQEGTNGEGDVLRFNGHKIGTLNNGSYWAYQQEAIAMTDSKWESVTDDLKRGNNFAVIQSKGNFIVPVNAFLRLIFPPDLNMISMTVPEYTPIGIEHSIDATIKNDGRSDAHDFNVTFYIDGMKMRRIPHLDLATGESMTLHLYNWTPMLPGHVYNLTAAADVLSGEDWTEVETDNNALSQHVIITKGGFGNESGPVGSGGEGERTGGVFTEEITGRVMNSMISAAFGGGGGAGIFSLWEWILKLGMLTACALTFGVGYWREQRRHNRRM